MKRTRILASLAAAAALGFAPGAAVAAPAAAAPYCGITWGSLTKTSGDLQQGEVTGIRSGRHTCYDRLVVDIAGPRPGYRVDYVAQVHRDGSGEIVPLRGGAALRIIVREGATTVPSMPSVAGFTTFRDVAWAGSFEGQTTIGLGVRARLPFRVFTLSGPAPGESRLVVDVAHHW